MSSKQIFIDSLGPVTITKNRQATRLKITLKPDGTIRVTIPWMSTFRVGEKFLSENLHWIEQTKEKLSKKTGTPRQIKNGRLFSTRNYHYEVCPAEVGGVRIRYDEKEKIVYFEYPQNQLLESIEIQDQLKMTIENVLRFDAKKYLPSRIAELASIYGYQFQKVTIKNNRTNWGSCSNRKNINLNLHLMRLNDRMIDYIIVHELVHTIIPNHGPDFHATMRKHFPDYSEMDKVLKKTKTEIY